jgi:Holliday junction resolvase RusA-like endonuclease
MIFSMVIAYRRPSVNSKGKGRSGLAKAIREIVAQTLGTSLPFPSERDLYIRATWFRMRQEGPDTDNIAKWVIDALKGHVYADDSQLAKCLIEKVDTGDAFEVVDRVLPLDLADTHGKLIELLAEQRPHILYIEVGRMGRRRVVFGPIDEASNDKGTGIS